MIDLTNRQNCFYWQTDRDLSPEDYKRIFLGRHEVAASTLTDVLRNGITIIPNIKNIEIVSPDENVVKGNVNIVRKVLIDGATYVVRMHPQGVKNGYFYVEQLALRKTVLAGVPAPEIMEIHEARNESDMDFVLMASSPGVNMDVYLGKDKSPEETLLIDCGKQMAKIHSVEVEGYGSFDNRVAKSEKRLVGLHKTYDSFIHVGLEENLHRLIKYGIIDQSRSDSMSRVFNTHLFEPLDKPRLIHNDFADWNLLTDGKKLTAVLDWDECHAGDPTADLACWSTFFSIERMKKFLEGYTSIVSLPKDYEERFHFYRLRYTISKMALRIKRYQVDKAQFIIEKLKVGKEALKEETQWFDL